MFFTNFIGNNTYDSAAKIIFFDGLYCIDSAKISFGSNNYLQSIIHMSW